MADTDDVQGYGPKFENQLERLREADIDERDRKAILQLVRRWDASASINQGTIVSYLNRLRLSAERSDVPLVEMDLELLDRVHVGVSLEFADLRLEHDAVLDLGCYNARITAVGRRVDPRRPFVAVGVADDERHRRR